LATTTAKLNKEVNKEADLKNVFVSTYQAEEFIWVMPDGQLPKTSAVIGSNYVQMQIAIDQHSNRVVVSAVIDNLVKGAAGQAIQNANLMVGFHEFAGLTGTGIGA